jgi:hypothetical protein
VKAWDVALRTVAVRLPPAFRRMLGIADDVRVGPHDRKPIFVRVVHVPPLLPAA